MAMIEAEVVRVLDYALVVRLPDGRKGRIRKREVSWHELANPLHEMFHVGQQIEAVILKSAGLEELVDVIIREAEGTPWHDFPRTHPVGDTVEGWLLASLRRGCSSRSSLASTATYIRVTLSFKCAGRYGDAAFVLEIFLVNHNWNPQ